MYHLKFRVLGVDLRNRTVRFRAEDDSSAVVTFKLPANVVEAIEENRSVHLAGYDLPLPMKG